MIAKTITMRDGRQASPRAIEAALTPLPYGVYYLIAFYLEMGNDEQLCIRWTSCQAGLTNVIERLHNGTLGPTLRDRVACGMPCEEIRFDRKTGETECNPINGGIAEFALKYLHRL